MGNPALVMGLDSRGEQEAVARGVVWPPRSPKDKKEPELTLLLPRSAHLLPVTSEPSVSEPASAASPDSAAWGSSASSRPSRAPCPVFTAKVARASCWGREWHTGSPHRPPGPSPPLQAPQEAGGHTDWPLTGPICVVHQWQPSLPSKVHS